MAHRGGTRHSHRKSKTLVSASGLSLKKEAQHVIKTIPAPKTAQLGSVKQNKDTEITTLATARNPLQTSRTPHSFAASFLVILLFLVGAIFFGWKAQQSK